MAMQARFQSRCPACQDNILPGQEIVRTTEFRAFVHVTCPDSRRELAGVLPKFPGLLQWLHETQGYLELLGTRAQNPTIRVRFLAGEREYVILAPKRSPVTVCTSGNTGRRWFQIREPDGKLYPLRPVHQDLHPILSALAELEADPAGAAARFGRATGRCCFCSLSLSDPRSMTVGYGPVCAEHFHLPWGEDYVADILG